MGHWQWNSPSIFCVNVLVRPTRISQRRTAVGHLLQVLFTPTEREDALSANELYHEGPHARQRRRRAPVAERARRVNGEYIAKARTLDHEHSRQVDEALPRRA
jgi:hypothetical protein